MEKRTDYSTNKYTLLYLPKWDRCTRFIFMFTAIQCLSCQTNFRLLLSTCGHHTKCPGSNHAKKKLVFAYLVVDYLKQLNRARWFCRSYRWIVVRMIIVTDNWRWINCFTPHTWWVCKLHKKRVIWCRWSLRIWTYIGQTWIRWVYIFDWWKVLNQDIAICFPFLCSLHQQ